MAWIRAYNCATGAGNSVGELWDNLIHGRQNLTSSPRSLGKPSFQFTSSANAEVSIERLLIQKLEATVKELEPSLSRDIRLGVILASTKGMVNDFVWDESVVFPCDDPLTPILNGLLHATGLEAERAVCVSHACSGMFGAMALSQRWLDRGLDEVLVVAADAVSPFVVRGFESLNLISRSQARPFDQHRNGFFLGDAAAAFVLSRTRRSGDLHLRRIGLDSEGSVVTRPQTSSQSVIRAALTIPGFRENPPEVIVAHGTGTPVNDLTEDMAFAELFPLPGGPLITGTKWCVGHTLAVSGALDLIAACEALRHQKLFGLATTEQVDSKFKNRYVLKPADCPEAFSRVMISSLGFGGMHASAVVEIAP